MLFLFIYLIYGEDDICINKDDLIVDDCSKDNIYKVENRMLLFGIDETKAEIEVGANKTLISVLSLFNKNDEMCIKMKCKKCKIIKSVGDKCGKIISFRVLTNKEGVLTAEIYNLKNAIIKYILIGFISLIVLVILILIIVYIYKKKKEVKDIDENEGEKEMNDI